MQLFVILAVPVLLIAVIADWKSIKKSVNQEGKDE